MRWLAPIVLTIVLSGCTEDKGALIARCDLDATKQFGLGIRSPNHFFYIQTCMRAAGYERLHEGDCSFGTYSASCYQSATWWGRLMDRK